MRDKEYSFDQIADKIFAPMYPVIADDIIKHTGITKGKMLDLGCGGGHLGLNLLKKTELTADMIDIHPQAVKFAAQRAKDWGLGERVSVTVQDVHNLEFPSEYADLVVSRGSMGFWEDVRKAFSKIWRVLAPGGKTYIGGGLGNFETQKIVKERMKEIDPEWPKSATKMQHTIPTEDFVKMFDELGYPNEIIDNMESGRWIILKKPV